jgi:hypothetical protein
MLSSGWRAIADKEARPSRSPPGSRFLLRIRPDKRGTFESERDTAGKYADQSNAVYDAAGAISIMCRLFGGKKKRPNSTKSTPYARKQHAPGDRGASLPKLEFPQLARGRRLHMGIVAATNLTITHRMVRNLFRFILMGAAYCRTFESLGNGLEPKRN